MSVSFRTCAVVSTVENGFVEFRGVQRGTSPLWQRACGMCPQYQNSLRVGGWEQGICHFEIVTKS
jgi:hypothetical protein